MTNTVFGRGVAHFTSYTLHHRIMYSDKQQASMEQHEQNQNERAATAKSSSRNRLQD